MPPGCLAVALLLFLLVLGPLLVLNLLTAALVHLGIAPHVVPLLVVGIVLGGLINIPIWRREVLDTTASASLYGVRWPWLAPGVTTQVLCVNLGGCVIPVGLSVYEILRLPGETVPGFCAVLAVVVAVSYGASKVVPGQGVAMRPLFPAMATAVLSLWLVPHQATMVAFASGILGVLVGGDLLRLRGILDSGISIASIGGAGTFDGVLLTGIVAVLLV